MPYTLCTSNCTKFKAKGALDSDGRYSPFLFDSFINNDKYFGLLCLLLFTYLPRSLATVQRRMLSYRSLPTTTMPTSSRLRFLIF